MLFCFTRFKTRSLAARYPDQRHAGENPDWKTGKLGAVLRTLLENGQSEAHVGDMSESHHRSCKCGAVYDRSEHVTESREISSFECAMCGATIENWNSAWVPQYRFIACPARTPND
jgi:hypothetical protein